MSDIGKCCFCGEPCNPCSQSCGRCARYLTGYSIGMYTENEVPKEITFSINKDVIPSSPKSDKDDDGEVTGE